MGTETRTKGLGKRRFFRSQEVYEQTLHWGSCSLYEAFGRQKNCLKECRVPDLQMLHRARYLREATTAFVSPQHFSTLGGGTPRIQLPGPDAAST